MVSLLLSDLQNKDIISLFTGNNLGRIVDVEIDEKGNIVSMVCEPKKFFLRFFKNKETTFKFTDIEKIGTDVILLKI